MEHRTPETLPLSIRKRLASRQGEKDAMGMSGASVFFYEDLVLKISDDDQEARTEAQMLSWLQGRLPVPECLELVRENGKQYLLMTRLPGRMLCDEALMEQPVALLSLIAMGLRRLWRVPIQDCPCDQSLARKLAAEARVRRGLCDMEDAEPETYGPGGFSSPAELLSWLKAHPPKEDRVLSHGDFCLPNIFVEQGKISGYLDLGRGGVADRYQDIALAYRSLKHNYDGSYGGTVYPGFRPERLFDALNIQPDWEKIKYYILLDELF